MPRKQRRNRDGVVVTRKANGRWMTRVWDRELKRYRSTSYATERQAIEAARIGRAKFDLGQDNAQDAKLAGIWAAYKTERLSDGKANERTTKAMQRVVDGLADAGVSDFKDRNFRAAVTRFFNTMKLTRAKGTNGKVAVSTRQRILSQVRALVNFAQRAGWLPNDPLAGYSPVGSREQDDTTREVFTLTEARAIVALHRPGDPVWVHAVLMLYAGLRESEARALIWADYDTNARLLWVRKGKGNKIRAVPVQAELADILIQVSDATGPTAMVARLPSTPIVAPRPGRVPCYQNFQALLLEAGITADRGIDPISTMPRRLTRHSCRHFYCAALLAAGTPGDQLRIVMGHGSVDLTSLYGSQVAMFARAASLEKWQPGELRLQSTAA